MRIAGIQFPDEWVEALKVLFYRRGENVSGPPTPHDLAGTDHTGSGLGTGDVVRATGSTTFAWQELQHTDLGSVTADLHHAQSHTLTSHSAKAHSELTNLDADDHSAIYPGISQTETITGIWMLDHLKKAMGVRNAADFASGSSTGGIQEAINDLPSDGGIVLIPAGNHLISASITVSCC